MHWFRSNLRLGSGLALVALTVQIVLSLVHVHLDSSRIAPGPIAGQSAEAPAASRGPTHHPNGPADDYCPICALIQLAGMSGPSVPPEVKLPEIADWVNLEPGLDFTLPALPVQNFRARAPPVA